MLSLNTKYIYVCVVVFKILGTEELVFLSTCSLLSSHMIYDWW